MDKNGKNKSKQEIISALEARGHCVEELPNDKKALKIVLDDDVVVMGEVSQFYATYFLFEKRTSKRKK